MLLPLVNFFFLVFLFLFSSMMSLLSAEKFFFYSISIERTSAIRGLLFKRVPTCFPSFPYHGNGISAWISETCYESLHFASRRNRLLRSLIYLAKIDVSNGSHVYVWQIGKFVRFRIVNSPCELPLPSTIQRYVRSILESSLL